MSRESLRLRSDVAAEPLIDRWYAWTHLIAPATAALNVAEKHVKMLESFVRAPQLHGQALNNPALAGGPYIDAPPESAGALRALLARTLDERRPQLDLARSLRELFAVVRETATGGPLAGAYASVPAALRGYVELAYDLDGHASFGLFEPLLYASPWYDVSAQTFALAVVDPDERRYAMNTPRLDAPGRAHWEVPFCDPRVDRLFALGVAGAPEGEIADLLGGGPRGRELARTLFTNEPRQAPALVEPGILRWRYLGHAGVLLETHELTVLVDPVVSYATDREPRRFHIDDLPARIDVVLITHAHWDHAALETLLRLRHRIGTVVVPPSHGGRLQDPSLKLALRAIGFRDVRELDALEHLEVHGGGVTAFPFLGEHADLAIGAKTAYAVELLGHRFAFVADSANPDPSLYERVVLSIGAVDVLFIGMECVGAPLSWLYGPLLPRPLSREHDRTRRLAGSDCAQALAMVQRLGCSEVYVYALGREPWLRHIMGAAADGPDDVVLAECEHFVHACRERGIRAERLYARHERVLRDKRDERS